MPGRKYTKSLFDLNPQSDKCKICIFRNEDLNVFYPFLGLKNFYAFLLEPGTLRGFDFVARLFQVSELDFPATRKFGAFD